MTERKGGTGQSDVDEVRVVPMCAVTVATGVERLAVGLTVTVGMTPQTDRGADEKGEDDDASTGRTWFTSPVERLQSFRLKGRH